VLLDSRGANSLDRCVTHALPPPAPPFARATRDERLAALGEQDFEVLVVGGGITGAGVARDAAMRGLRTVLVEKADLGSGTSSASSKLVHGGLRYLEQGELGLVFESVSERHRLGQLAPHLVRPIPFFFPIYERKPRPRWMVGLGLWAYDALALFRSYQLHRSFAARRAAELEPALRTAGLDGAVRYYDCMTDDARLVLETARSAHDAGAWVLPWCEVLGFLLHRAQVVGATVRDRRSGSVHEIRARVVVNATGPWTDRTLGLRGDRGRLLRPTKGVHVVVARQRLPVQHAVVLTDSEHHRVSFAVPWGNRVLLGTTDTDFEGDYDEVVAGRSDVAYLLDLANRYYPGQGLRDADVLGTYAGLRPLVGGEGLHPSQVSREHLVQVDDDGIITVAGGKLTTYRLMAAEVVDAVARRLRADGVHVGGCQTGSVRLPGGAGIRFDGKQLRTMGPDGEEAERELGARLGEDVAEHLQESYGGRWITVAARSAEDPAAGERIVPGLPYIWAEVQHAVQEEMACTLRDVMRRRTQLEIRDCAEALAVAPRVADRMGALLGWSAADAEAQVELFRRHAGRTMAWREGAGFRSQGGGADGAVAPNQSRAAR
jgi:glycerol-3-phosphate dehydrogenase